MAEWGGIARAVEEGLLDAGASGTSSGSLQGLAEALTGQDFAGFKMRDIFDKERWSRRERELQGRRLEETGIPDYTYDYVPRDQGRVEVDISPVTEQDTSRIGRNPDGSPLDYYGEEDSVRRGISSGRNFQGDPVARQARPGLGISNRFGDREFSPRINRSPLEGRFDLDKLRRDPAWIDKPSGIQNRFGDRTFSPRSRTDQGIAGDRRFGGMTLAEARRARELRNRPRQPSMGGGPAYQGHGLGHPDWSQIEAMIQRASLMDQLEREGGNE